MCNGMGKLTVWRELVSFKNGEAEDVLVQVFDKEMTAEVPFGVERVRLMTGRVTLSTHSELTVWVTLPYKTHRQSRTSVTK